MDTTHLTRVLPGTDAGAVVYIQEQGAFVGKRSEHLVVRKDEADLQRIPLCSIRQVVVFGNVQVSTQALETLAQAEIPVVYLTRYGRFIAVLEPAPTKNVMLRADQYRVFSDPARALSLARAVVKAKIANQRTLLMRSLRSQTGDRGQQSAVSSQQSAVSSQQSAVSSQQSAVSSQQSAVRARAPSERHGLTTHHTAVSTFEESQR